MFETREIIDNIVSFIRSNPALAIGSAIFIFVTISELGNASKEKRDGNSLKKRRKDTISKTNKDIGQKER